LGNFATAYPRYQSFPSDLWIDYAHNDYVQAMAETGLVGTVLIVSALGLFLYAAFGTSVGDQETGSGNLESEVQPESAISGQEREEEPPPPNPQLRIHGRWIRLGAALGCCGMLVHSIFDFNLHIPANAAWFAVLAGMACAPKVMQRHEEDVVDIG
jgi:O-antigen ligase